MKLMIRQTVCITESLSAEIKRVAENTNLSQLDVIRLSILKGLPAVEDFAKEESNNENKKNKTMPYKYKRDAQVQTM